MAATASIAGDVDASFSPGALVRLESGLAQICHIGLQSLKGRPDDAQSSLRTSTLALLLASKQDSTSSKMQRERERKENKAEKHFMD